MSIIEDHMRYIEETKLPSLRGQLADLESGRMKLGARWEIGPWIDTTPEAIRRLKEEIAEFEDIVAKLKAGETP